MSSVDPRPGDPLPRGNDVAARYEALAKLLTVQHGTGFRLTKRDGWSAVPVEEWPLDDDVERLVEECSGSSRDIVLWALALEDLGSDQAADDIEPALDVPCTSEGLAELDLSFGTLNYALMPPDAGWLVVCTSDDYCVVAAPTPRVATLIGRSPSEAFGEFATAAAQFEESSAPTAELMRAVSAELSRYPELRAGESVMLPAVWAGGAFAATMPDQPYRS